MGQGQCTRLCSTALSRAVTCAFYGELEREILKGTQEACTTLEAEQLSSFEKGPQRQQSVDSAVDRGAVTWIHDAHAGARLLRAIVQTVWLEPESASSKRSLRS
eukprot:5547985-Pleurochrysis_carterae.AAC.1